MSGGRVRSCRRRELLGMCARLLQRPRGARGLPGLSGRPRVPRQGLGADQMLLGLVQLRQRDCLRVVPGGILLLEHGKLAGGVHGRILFARQLGLLCGVPAGGVLHQHRSGMSAYFRSVQASLPCTYESTSIRYEVVRQRLTSCTSQLRSL